MYDRMGFEEYPHVYSDHWESYKEFFPRYKLNRSKRYTPPIERNNGRQRHCFVYTKPLTTRVRGFRNAI